MAEDEQYQRARERVRQLKGFYSHLAVYVVVNAGMFLLNLLTTPGQWWFWWVLVGWGIGLAANAVHVYGVSGWLGPDWEERKTRELMDKEREKKG